MTAHQPTPHTTDDHAKPCRLTVTLLACAVAVACAAFPAGAAGDAGSVAADGSLPGGGFVIEDGASSTNKVEPLRNHATLEVCINTSVHPDGAPLVRRPNATTWCFKGRGAGLNYPDGCERDEHGQRLNDVYGTHKYCHYINYLGGTVPAAKRQHMRPDGTIVAGSAVAWRPVMRNVAYANPWGFPACSGDFCR